MRTAILVCVSIFLGACSTTPPPLTPFPSIDAELMVPCERPQSLPASQEAPKAADAIATVTANYARHHRCADRLDAAQSWIRKQEGVKP